MMIRLMLIILIAFTNVKAQNKIYTINVICDWSYTGGKSKIQKALIQTNNFFKNYNIEFEIKNYMVSGVIDEDLTLESTLDNFQNENFDITLAVVGIHSDEKVGLAFFKQFKRKLSCIVIDFNSIEEDDRGTILSHEILHLLGLDHSPIKNNIMNAYNISNKVTLEQEAIIKQYSY